MKKFVSVMLAMLLSVGIVNACIKKQVAVTAHTSPLSVIVMDTTQALLPQVKVTCGKQVLTTSFDGRIVLKSEQLQGVKSLFVSCEGYKEKKVAVPESNVLIVQLTPKPGKRPKEEKYHTLGSVRSAKGGEVMYKLTAMTDGVAVAEEAEYEMPHILPAYESNNISAGKLTAGEVNDFAKWYFWPKVIDDTHKQYVNDWRISPRQRFTVQVTDKYGYPIASRAVSLLDARGNTLFQAVTDNTGKAELWDEGTNRQIQVDDHVFPAKAWGEGMNTVVLDDEDCALSQDVDVAFVFDATGSMGDELRYLQAEMKDVISRAKAATGGLNIRTGAVVYRDHGDDYITRISRLTEDIETTKSFIDKQEAEGGGDFPEAVPEALMAAMNSIGWNADARARIVFLILDAPCHQDSASLALLHEQILNAAALGVRIVPVVCSGLDKSGELLVRSIALVTNGTSFFLTDDSGIGHPHLQPTTDTLQVEHLNDMLVRTIVEFSYMPDCRGKWHEDQIENVEETFMPNPFDEKDLEQDNSVPHGPTTLYLLDVSGKLIYIYQGVLEEAGDSQLASLRINLSTGIYFVKAFYDGKWHVKKILVH